MLERAYAHASDGKTRVEAGHLGYLCSSLLQLAIDHREDISLAEAIAWANSLPEHVTLFLYDAGS
jgi:hypothetical protein